MKKDSVIFIAGHRGLVGSAVLRDLKKKNYKKLITVDRKKLDLKNYEKINRFFNKKKIDYIIMAAARAGGILANSNFQKDFFLENIEIQNNLLKLALNKKVKRVVFLGTSCIYPKLAKNPISENSLLTGELEKTNQCYAIAKIAGIKLSEALYNDQNLDVVCLMPTNIYGVNDNYDPFSAHVIPAMINKIHAAKKKSKKSLKLLGTGKPVREFLYSDDLASAIYRICITSKKKLFKYCGNKFPIINVGSGKSITIKNLSKLISKILDYKGKIYFDKRFPDGTKKKNLNSKIINSLGWNAKTSLEDGLKKSIEFYINNYSK